MRSGGRRRSSACSGTVGRRNRIAHARPSQLADLVRDLSSTRNASPATLLIEAESARKTWVPILVEFQIRNTIAVSAALTVGVGVPTAVGAQDRKGSTTMTHPNTDFLKYIGTPFEHFILPITPAGATLSTESVLTAEHLGKIPGT